MNNIKIGMVSLGCSKNQYDAEMMLYVIRKNGWEIVSDPEEGDAVIINTCGFIESAKQEAIDTILEFCELKKEGQVKAVIVTGCLAERYQDELYQQIPEIDVVLGIGSNNKIIENIEKSLEGKKIQSYGEKTSLCLEGDRILIGASHFAYVKISEGCDNKCAYCAIPMIRGGFRSRKIENIVEEVKTLASRGVKEVNIVAQDTSKYGFDLYGKYMLPELLKEVCKVDGIVWVRVLYCYPDKITDELLEVMANEEKIVKYLDIPIQHCNGKVLREMNRPGNKETLLSLVHKIREKLPDVVLRTTLIAGFPGETDEEFEELCEFVKESKFERLGCFAYSQEENTVAGERTDQIDEEIRQKRAELIMEVQSDIAFKIAENQIGKELLVMVEDKGSEGYYGRSYMDAPDIDTRVYFKSNNIYRAGDFVKIKVTETFEYDLIGTVVE